MTFGEAIATCMTKKYVTFEGRASRSEYWYFVLFYVLCSIGSALGYILGDAIGMFLSGLVGLVCFCRPSACWSDGSTTSANRDGSSCLPSFL